MPNTTESSHPRSKGEFQQAEIRPSLIPRKGPVNRVGDAQIPNRAVQGAAGNMLFVFHGSGAIHRQVSLTTRVDRDSGQRRTRRIRKSQVPFRATKSPLP